MRAVDAWGTVDPTPASHTWTIVDETAPETTIESGPTTITDATSATFTFSSSESASTFECALDSASFSSCTSPHVRSDLAAGDHSLHVRATDASGNIDATPASYAWTVIALPETTIDSGPAAVTESTSATFTFSGSGTVGFECSLEGAAFADCTPPLDITDLATGDHTFAVRGLNSLGTVDATPATHVEMKVMVAVVFAVGSAGPPVMVVSGGVSIVQTGRAGST